MFRFKATRRVRGFTLIEILVATVLTLVLMGMVVTVFGTVTEEISNSRAGVEVSDGLRSTQLLLQRDLSGVTVPTVPPRRPEEGDGYIEIIEGPIGPVLPLRPYDSSVPVDNIPDGYDIAGTGTLDNVDIEGTTLGDFDDVLMFTSRNLKTPFRGNVGSGSISSPVAEVIWFLRGTTLYRRVLLVAPRLASRINNTADPLYVANAFTSSGFYGKCDLSVRQIGNDPAGNTNDINAATSGLASRQLVLNTLGDLTKRENRYGHQPHVFPYDARFWGLLGMPTLQECSFFSDTTDPTTGRWPFPLQNGTTTYETGGPQEVTVGGRIFDLILPEQIKGTTMSAFAVISGASGVVPGYINDYVAAEFRHQQTIADKFEPWFNPLPWKVTLPPPPANAVLSIVDPQNGTLTAYDLGDFAVGGYFADPKVAATPAGSTRIAEDVVLTNVLAFDVKVWDPGAPVLEHKTSAGALVSVLPGDPGYIDRLIAAKSVAANYPTGPTTANTTFIASFGAYVDLNYMCRLGSGVDAFTPAYDVVGNTNLSNIGAPQPWFHGPGDPRSQLMGTLPNTAPTIATARAAVYDTWSTHYEYDGIDQDGDGLTDEGTDGFDNPLLNTTPFRHTTPVGGGVNGIDDFNELEATPPYAAPLKGVQITIRVFEPDSRQIREVTIVQDFQAAASGTNYE